MSFSVKSRNLGVGLLFSLGAALAFMPPGEANAAISYTLTDLGGFNGATSSVGFGVNDAGQVTGTSNRGAWIYSNGVMTDLGLGGAYGQAINNFGQVVGQGAGGSFFYSNGSVSYFGDQGSVGYDINNAGQITGWDDRGDRGERQAFIYSNGVMTDLGTLGGASSYGYAINDSGQVVGASNLSSGHDRAFFYSNGVMSDLGTLGGNSSVGQGVNNKGQVVGSSNLADYQYGHAFLYSNGVMTDLGVLAGGLSSQAYAINDSGVIVGTADDDVWSRAFVYTDGIMHDLNALIDPASGWFLVDAYSINNKGQITGNGLFNGEARAFLLTPTSISSAVPEPATWAMMITGFGIVGTGLRRRNRAMAFA